MFDTQLCLAGLEEALLEVCLWGIGHEVVGAEGSRVTYWNMEKGSSVGGLTGALRPSLKDGNPPRPHCPDRCCAVG